MNISYNWLRSLAPTLDDSPARVAERLALYGAPVDEIVSLAEPLRSIVIGRVTEVRKHPNSEHLSLCKVDAGTGELLNVVCGAPNVRAQRFYPFAPVGAVLPEGITIARRKIRGEESQGMLCSARELQLGRDHEGILELQGDFTPGEPFAAATGLDDYRIVVDVTPNRSDLLSHVGVARELAARGNAAIVLPPFPGQPAGLDWPVRETPAEGSMGGTRVRIDAPAACPRYMAAVIRGVRVGPSPEWLASRLRAVGQRPISNVVDATNYVLQELGQPLHAFDLQRLAGPAIVVRYARPGETLVTLDGQERKLDASMLVIADAERATALAGVMGGAKSEVHEATADVLIECAHFEPRQIRATRRALGLSTEASYRFERGVDPEGMERALRRVVDLILACAGGSAEPELLDVCPAPFPERTLDIRLDRARQVLGVTFTAGDVSALLEPIGFTTVSADDGQVQLHVPGYRWFDIKEEIDLVEEIARRHGYTEFPDEPRPFRASTVPDHPLSRLEDELRAWLAGSGLLEARTAAFASAAEGEIELVLPLALTDSHLRRALLPGLVQRAEYNFTRGTRDIRLFEIGTVFQARPGTAAPAEATRLALVLTGARAPAHWTGAAGDFEIWDLKGLATDLAARLGLALRPGHDHAPAGAADWLDANASFELLWHDRVVGVAGRVLPARVDAPAWAGVLFGLEVEVTAQMRPPMTTYRTLPVLPAIEQDLALVVPDAVPAQQVEELLRAVGGPLLEVVVPFDEYRGTGLPERTRSIGYRLRFRALDRTLTDSDARTLVGRMLKRLKDEHGIERRG